MENYEIDSRKIEVGNVIVIRSDFNEASTPYILVCIGIKQFQLINLNKGNRLFDNSLISEKNDITIGKIQNYTRNASTNPTVNYIIVSRYENAEEYYNFNK